MKRFINIGKQLHEDTKANTSFAFYCTATQSFETFSECQTFDSVSDFIMAFDRKGEIQRYLDLIPVSYRSKAIAPEVSKEDKQLEVLKKFSNDIIAGISMHADLTSLNQEELDSFTDSKSKEYLKLL